MLPHFKLYYKTLVLILKTVALAQKWTHRSREQNKWLETNLSIYSLLIHGKLGMNIQWAKDSVFNKGC